MYRKVTYVKSPYNPPFSKGDFYPNEFNPSFSKFVKEGAGEIFGRDDAVTIETWALTRDVNPQDTPK